MTTQLRRQKPFNPELLNFIADYRTRYGYAPTYRDMQAACGLRSTNTVAYHIDAMRDQGYITRPPRQSARAVALTDAANAYLTHGTTLEQPTTIKIVIPDPISVNAAYMPIVRNGRAALILTLEAKEYKRTAAQWAVVGRNNARVYEPLTGHIAITEHLYGALDIDNFQKLTRDALNKVVWEDDKQVVEAHQYKHDEDADGKRVELFIREIAP